MKTSPVVKNRHKRPTSCHPWWWLVAKLPPGSEPISASVTLCFTLSIFCLSLSFWILSPPLPLCFSSLCVFLSHTHSLPLPLSSWPPSCSFIINSSRSLQSLLFLGFTWPRRPCRSNHPPAPLRLRRSRTQELLSTFTAFCVNGLLHGNT